MKNRERVLATLHFERPDDRLPMIEWASWWDRTLDAWHSQGLSTHIPWDGLATALGLDRHVQFWLPHRTADCPQPTFNGGPVMEDEQDYEDLLEKTKEFPQYLYCRNFKGKALHRKQSGCVKKCMETKIGSWTQFCRSLKTVICMKKWGIARREKQRSLTKDSH